MGLKKDLFQVITLAQLTLDRYKLEILERLPFDGI